MTIYVEKGKERETRRKEAENEEIASDSRIHVITIKRE